MTSQSQSHLTDEALDDVLIGLGSSASHAHLEICSECRARIDAFRSSVDHFNQASLAFAGSRAVKTRSFAAPARRFHAPPVLAAWVAAAVLAAVAGPAVWHLFAPHPVHAPVIAEETRDSDIQIAEDNELLRQVNAAIAPDEQSIIDQYHLLKSQSSQEHPKVRTE